jgi:hypothetical protein
MICVNRNFGVIQHQDHKDFHDGICCVIIFGDFKGGELCFLDLDLLVETRDGGLVFFFSAKHQHVVNKYVGNRNSVTLFTPNNVIINDSV